MATTLGVWLYDREDLDRLTLLPVELAKVVAFSPDGSTLVSGSGHSSGGIELWDLSTGTRSATLHPRAWVKYMAISPDGGTLASGTSVPGIELWDLETGTRTTLLEGQTSPGTSISFSPDGATLVSGEEDGSVRLWDLAGGTNTATFKHEEEASSVSFSPDGATVASASWDGTVTVWDIASGAEVAILEGLEAQVYCVSYSPDPAVLASGASGGTVKVWDLERAKVETYSGQGGFVHSVAFSPDGSVLASGTEGSVFLWDRETGEATPLQDAQIYPGLAFSPDGGTLATTTYLWDGSIELWDVATGQRTGILTEASRSKVIAFSPDGQTFAQGVYRGEVKLLDLATGTIAGTLGPMRTIPGNNFVADVTSAAFSPDGRTLAVGTNEDVIYLWDLESRARIGTLLGDVDQPGGVGPLLFSSDGGTLAAGSSSGRIRLWDVATSTSTATIGFAHQSRIHALSFSPDGSILASGSGSRVNIWDVAGSASVRTLRMGGLGDMVHFSDGTLYAAGSADDLVRLWGVVPRHDLAALEGHADSVYDMLFSPGGEILASSSYDGTVLLWDVPLVLPRPQVLNAIGGEEQEGLLGSSLVDPFVVEVRDQYGKTLEGAEVAFAITAGSGALSAALDTTDASGRATTTLTLGEEIGTYTVVATVADLEPLTFTATARATPDFDLDGEVGFSDFFVFAEAFGGSDPRFDLDGSGEVDFADFFLFAENFGQPARAKLVALARELIGLPDGPQLRQNAPNPFNSGTVISWFQLQPGLTRLEVFAVTGQRVAVLHEGPRKAGLHRLRWDGRDDRGRALGSGVYVYRLVTAEAVQTRKLTLLR
ncbi:MAG: Ig-like domain-containing protein [Gemmatimonadaceae bacterium]|nr:Ig-like domain-containing protein [Gemmatimonadaceae bacterium]